ncbi:MAG: hypothetical protein V4550_10305 [Gemmatimonadota bacterium]
MRKAIRIGLMISIAFGLSGCLGGATEPVIVIGKYQLESVNGASLPYIFPNGVGIKSEVIELKEDGSFTDNAEHSDGTTLSDVGTYTNYGNTVILYDQTLGFVYQGLVDGKTMSVTVGSYTERFVRP